MEGERDTERERETLEKKKRVLILSKEKTVTNRNA